MFRPQKVKVFKRANGTAKIKRDSYSSGKEGWYDWKAKVKVRSGGKCEAIKNGRRCYAKAKDTHHIIPLSRGGRTCMTNLIDLCEDCHDERHTHMRIKR